MYIKINTVINYIKNNYEFVTIVFILIVIITVTSFFEIRLVKGTSMTRQDYYGERSKYEIVFAKKIRNKKKSLKISKGDIIIYKIPFTQKVAMKRIIACPLDIIYINKKNIMVNNKKIYSKYDWRLGLFSLTAMGDTNISTTIPWLEMEGKSLIPRNKGIEIRYTACLFEIIECLKEMSKIPYDKLCIINSKPFIEYKDSINLYTNFISNMSIKVPNQYYFVLADNPIGYDSRYHGFVSKKNIISRVLYRLILPK